MTRNDQLSMFTEPLLAGDRRRCFALVEEWEQQQLPDELLYNDILIPALAQVGTGWEENSQSIVSEHIATQIVKQVLAYKAFRGKPAARNGKKALIGCVPNEYHDVASTILANILEREGWEVYHYGNSVPTHDILQSASALQPDLVCFTMKSVGSMEVTEQLLRDLRALLPSTRVMIGGLHMPGLRAVLAPFVDKFADSFGDGADYARSIAAQPSRIASEGSR